jgi:ATP phosphoribosyltransferase
MLTTDRTAGGPSQVALLPKNRGLLTQLTRIRERYPLSPDAELVGIRGEDVPFLANEFVRMDRPVIAFTGDDLLNEWLARGNTLDSRLVRWRIAWSDPAAIYGAPALCLIGASPDILKETRPLRVMVCGRYRRSTEIFLAALRDDGISFETLGMQGSLETCVTNGVADLVVDIVVTGATVRQAGLCVLRVISTSDIAVLESR